MSEWVDTTLGEVLAETDERNNDGSVDVVLSVTEGRGIIRQTDVFKKRIATDNTSKYKIVWPLDIAWNPYLLWTGAVGQWLGEGPGVTSPVYPVFRAKEGQEARYWGLVLVSGLLTPYFNSTAVGSIQRRRRTTPAVFKSANVKVPPLAEQRRIVDVMAAVDVQVEALKAEAAGAARSRAAMLDTLLSDGTATWPKELLGSLGTFIRGRRFTKADYVVAGLGCIHYGQIYTHYGPLARRTITFLPIEFRARMRLAQPGDLVIAATGEDPVEVGKSVAWLGEEPVAVHDDGQIFRHGLEPRFAAYVTASTDFQRQKRRLVSDMKVARVSSKDLASIEISVPPRAEQERIANVIEAFDLEHECLMTELTRLRTFRSTLLTSLLSQDVEIPGSYDAALPTELEVAS